MISGAVESFDPLGEEQIGIFCRSLGRRLIEENYDVISGVGKGISGSLMIGAHEALTRPDSGRIGQRLRLFPFPYWMPEGSDRDNYYSDNRREMASQGGITIVISGNKLDPKSGGIINSPGVLAEVEMAKDAGQFIIPVGATGHAARHIWGQVSADADSWFPNIDAGQELERLGDSTLEPDQLVQAVFDLINKIRKLKP
jgi:hypothetical protein